MLTTQYLRTSADKKADADFMDAIVCSQDWGTSESAKFPYMCGFLDQTVKICPQDVKPTMIRFPEIAQALEPYRDPLTVSEALRRPDGAKWQEAIDAELASLKAKGTYKLHKQLPEGKDILTIRSKFVFKLKFNADGSIDKYKLSEACSLGMHGG